MATWRRAWRRGCALVRAGYSEIVATVVAHEHLWWEEG